MMRCKTLLVISCLALFGCQSPIDDMMNNEFVTVKPQTSPSNLIGVWSGNMGPYLTSFKIDKDGTGLFCYSYGTSDVLQKIKYNNDILHIQDGTKLNIINTQSENLILKSSYAGAQKTTLIKDNDLLEASHFCAERFKR